jgi:cysteine-S-conjugate beta-lyase
MTQLTTELIHHPYTPPEGFDAPQAGVFKASTVLFPNVAAMRSMQWKDKTGYTYGLHGTPTSYLLEEKLCTLEGGTHCILLPSGLAAITCASFALLKTGDEVLIPDNSYGPNQALADGELKAMGVSYQLYDAMNPADLAARISDRTKLVWLEAAGSITLEFPDLVELVRICKARGVTTVLDNTWGAGLAFKPFDLTPGATVAGAEPLGVDVTVHALTKYPSGGGDVLMGSCITRDDAIALKLKNNHMRFGWNVGMNDVELVLRSLASMALRYAAHDAAARQLAAWCQTRPEFAQVLHPALVDSPGHAHWKVLCDGASGETPGRAAGLFSVIFKPEFAQRQVDAFVDALDFFSVGYSWGGPESLVVPYNLGAIRPRWPAHIAQGRIVRFSVGLENAADLQADLARALDNMVR